MRKAPIIFLLLIALLWQTVAMAHVGFGRDHGSGAAHVALHLEEEPHHHHDDGSFHQDSSDESVKHVYADGYANTAGFVPAHTPDVQVDARSVAQLSGAPAAHDSPVLEGPRRPPRLTA